MLTEQQYFGISKSRSGPSLDDCATAVKKAWKAINDEKECSEGLGVV